MKGKYLHIVLIIICVVFKANGQTTVFDLFKNDIKKADEFFERGNFHQALDLYLNQAHQRGAKDSINLKIARCRYFLKQYDLAIAEYEKGMNENIILSSQDIYYYAEAQTSASNFTKAAEYYKKYLNENGTDPLIFQKLWRLNNVQYLYEDSSHFSVRLLPLNTINGELCAVPYKSGIVFLSNRNNPGGIQRIDAALDAPFYQLYYSEVREDTTGIFNAPYIFSQALNSKFHTGKVAFYQQSKKMVFTVSGKSPGSAKIKTLGLHFAEDQDGKWTNIKAFPFNSKDYSLCDPTISEDGTLLFFSSDMKGGQGGRDLYKSEYVNGEWTQPVNLGEKINTRFDESFPCIQQKRTLYFSSNGHAGLGGMDIFKVQFFNNIAREVENMGYPMNSGNDDFGIFIDSTGNHGYFTSNREFGGYDDNLYEFEMDVQSYPLEISGTIKYIEHNWADSSELKILPNVKLDLIDHFNNITTAKCVADSSGNFSLMVPYFSKYKIRVKGQDIGEGVVSFEVPKHSKINNDYNIVVVKDDFKGNENKGLE